MGMRIGNSGMVQGGGAAQWQQRQQGVKDMMAALSSGDLGAAQKAYAGLTSGAGVPAGGPLAQIGQALQNGDLAGAQQAAQAMQARRGGHHHRHQDTANAPAAPAATNTPATGTGSTIDLVA